MLPDTEWAEAQGVADRVRLAIAETPLSVFEDQIRITASIGTAELPSETCSIEEVLTLTREGLHNAKDSGGNRVCATPRAGEESGNGNGNGRGHRHDRKGRNGNGRPDSQIDEIRQLLRRKGAFRAVAQPIYNLADESVAGYELLSRGPQGPFEMPTDFFRICLEDNFLTTVDLHCLKNCVAATANLEHRGRFHVNLFPSTLLATPPERLISLLQTDDDSVFCIEMSEQQFLSDPACLMEQIAAFKKAGILVAMDDVGFGRSSLEALVLLEPDLVKIDPNYVSGISAESRKLRSFERLIRMAQSLDAEVVAEGIETTADLALLRDLGVGYGQGFLWGRPS
jgi:EAL domain-containing protein (putative c-di-GMP-specific phosphodiesterase class I)